MTDEMTQDEIEPLIGTGRIDELPEKTVTDLFYQHGECENCGEETISMAYDMRDSEYVCYTCDTEYEPLETEAGKLQIVEKVKERREQKREARAQKSSAEHKKDRNANLGKMFIAVGALFCLTVIGIPIGLILIYLGVRLQPDSEAEDGDEDTE